MKKMLMSIAAVVLVALIGSVVTFGAGKTFTQVRAALSGAEQNLDASMPDQHLEQVIVVKLKDHDSQIRKYHSVVGKLDDRHAAAQAAVAEKENRLQGQKDLLKRAKLLLDQGHSQYQIAGKSVSKDQLAVDAQTRLASCEELKAQIERERKLAQQLKQAADEGRANLVQAQRVRQQLVAELEVLKARLETARARNEVNELAAQLRDQPPFAPDSELGRAMQQLKDRTREAERQADLLATETKAGGTVDWSAPVDVTKAIADFLDKDGGNNGNSP